jgi:hypothetical protein
MRSASKIPHVVNISFGYVWLFYLEIGFDQWKKQTCTNTRNSLISVSWLISFILHNNTCFFLYFYACVWRFMERQNLCWDLRNERYLLLFYGPSYICGKVPAGLWLLATDYGQAEQISTCLASGLQNTDTVPFYTWLMFIISLNQNLQ